MAELLVSDTNTAIKLAFFKNKFFEDNFISLGALALWDKVVKTEVIVHLKNPEKKHLEAELKFLKDCEYYYEFEFDEYNYYYFKSSHFVEALENISNNGGLLGTSDNDQMLLYLALVNSYHLVTNEYALTDLGNEVVKLPDLIDYSDVKMLTAEDLVLCAYAENKLTKVEVQELIDKWKAKKEFILNTKKEDFKKLGFKI
jgi:hypothetical protein